MAVKRKLTFVVGAGASYELGLPVGRGLLDDISKLIRKETSSFHGDRFGREVHYKIDNKDLESHIEDLIRKNEKSITTNVVNAWKKDAYWITENCSLAPSIDNLLHTHQNNSRIVALGKLMICAALKNAESNSCLMPTTDDHSTNSFLYSDKHWGSRKTSGAASWLSQMFWLLAEGSKFDDFLEALRQVSFISFNYDRCIEHYLIHAAKSYFRLANLEDMSKVASTIHIVYPYGSLSALRTTEIGAHGFGKFDLTEAASEIKTFTEGMEDTKRREAIDGMLERSDELVFLGFGFNDQNLELIFNKASRNNLRRISGTTLGFSKGNQFSVVAKLFENARATRLQNSYRLDKDDIVLEDLTCHDFFSANSVRLRS